MKHAPQRPHQLPFPWPDPPLQIVLVEPEIPPNTGNIARLCAATGSVLHLVGPLGFRLTAPSLRRAGLDYWDAVTIVRHSSFQTFRDSTAFPSTRCHLFSTKARQSYLDSRYRPGDHLVFGSESSGLSNEILNAFPDRVYAIPIRPDHVRSLNLATAVAVVLYEALRQIRHPA